MSNRISLLCFACALLLVLTSGIAAAEEKPRPRQIGLVLEGGGALGFAHVGVLKVLSEKAKGVLVFPGITKGGFIVGGQYGEGVLFQNGKATGFYNTASASFGMQAGLQKFGYALFFMTESDLAYLKKSEGWEIGVGPSITIIDKGKAGAITTTTAREGVYAFFFEQRGLMAGLGLQGTKISQMTPDA